MPQQLHLRLPILIRQAAFGPINNTITFTPRLIYNCSKEAARFNQAVFPIPLLFLPGLERLSPCETKSSALDHIAALVKMFLHLILFLCLPLAWAGIPDGYDFWWTALGDSYASGVGSGTYTGGRRCLRYDQAYPVQMQGNNDLGLGTTPEEKRLFQNVVCSGAEVEDIESWQLLDDDTSSQPSYQYGKFLTNSLE